MENPEEQYGLDEIERLEKLCALTIANRNSILAHLFSWAGIGVAFWAMMSRPFFSGDPKTSPDFFYFLATGVIAGYVFFVSAICWLRLLNGVQELTFLRSRMNFIRVALARKGYSLPGYPVQNISTGDSTMDVSTQSAGITVRTRIAFLASFFPIFILLLISLLSLAEAMALETSFVPKSLMFGLATVAATFILFSMVAYLRISTQKAQKNMESLFPTLAKAPISKGASEIVD